MTPQASSLLFRKACSRLKNILPQYHIIPPPHSYWSDMFIIFLWQINNSISHCLFRITSKMKVEWLLLVFVLFAGFHQTQTTADITKTTAYHSKYNSNYIDDMRLYETDKFEHMDLPVDDYGRPVSVSKDNVGQDKDDRHISNLIHHLQQFEIDKFEKMDANELSTKPSHVFSKTKPTSQV